MVRNNRQSLQGSMSQLRSAHDDDASRRNLTSNPTQRTLFTPPPTVYPVKADCFHGDNFTTCHSKPSSNIMQLAPTITPSAFLQHSHALDVTNDTVKSPADYTIPFTKFLTENPTVFHCIDHFESKLSKAGFTKVGSSPNYYLPSLLMMVSSANVARGMIQ